jgi:hypothetical protein
LDYLRLAEIMEPNEPLVPRKSNTLAAVLIGVIVAALASGGGVYAYQKNQNNKSQSDLQSQVDSLQRQITAMKVIPSATPIASTVPSPTAMATPAATPVPALTPAQLQNFTYTDMNGIRRTLKNGTATYPATGSTGSLSTGQGDAYQAFSGDVDGDGVADTVVVLGDNEGGTGYWNVIAAVLDKNGQPVLGGETVALNDRASIQSITISGGLITVTGMEHGPDQSEADAPNQPVTETYKLVSGKLVAQQ